MHDSFKIKYIDTIDSILSSYHFKMKKEEVFKRLTCKLIIILKMLSVYILYTFYDFILFLFT